MTDAVAALVAMVTQTQFENLSTDTVARTRDVVLDTLACGIGGRDELGVPEARAAVTRWVTAGPASVWTTSLRLPPQEAAFVNGMTAHALDFDDQHPGVLHSGVTVVPAALAVASTRGDLPLAELLAAIVVGVEVADRLAVATIDGPGVSGWLLTPLCGYFGAAAAAARLMGLDDERTRHAVGFAYVQASGNGQSTLDGALAKRMQPGFAARGGVFAAELAAAGLTAPTDSLEGRRGYFRVYHGGRYQRDRLTAHLGERWLIDDVTFKPYPCCAWTHAALECGLEIHGLPIDPAQIERIEVGVNEQAYESTGTPLPRRFRPQTVVDAQFSIPYTFATAAIMGQVGLEDFSPEALRRPAVLDLAQRVSVRPEDAFSEGPLAREVSPARARVTLVDGVTHEITVEHPKGRGAGRLTRDDLEAKLLDCCRHAGMPALAPKLAAAVGAAENTPAVELLDLLATT